MKRVISASLCIAFCVVTAAAQSSFVVDSCNDGDSQSAQGGWWYTYNDSENGGNSFVFPAVHNFTMSKPGYGEKGFAAMMKGTVGNKLGWDYIGMGVNLAKSCQCPEVKPVNLKEFNKLQFKMKGTFSGGRLIVNMPYTENKCQNGLDYPISLTEWADYEAALTSKVKADWTTVTLDLRKDFHQPKWAKQNAIIPIDKVLENLKNINFHFSSPDGDSVEIWIDDVEFVK